MASNAHGETPETMWAGNYSFVAQRAMKRRGWPPILPRRAHPNSAPSPGRGGAPLPHPEERRRRVSKGAPSGRCVFLLPVCTSSQMRDGVENIAAQLRARVLGQRSPFRGAKTVEPFLGLAQRRLKGADPEARQHCLHPVPAARPVANELFVLAARPFGVFVLDRRNRRHAAVAPLAPQPTEEGAHQQLRVEPIGLGPWCSRETATLEGWMT